jgi:hypothetical protein
MFASVLFWIEAPLGGMVSLPVVAVAVVMVVVVIVVVVVVVVVE